MIALLLPTLSLAGADAPATLTGLGTSFRAQALSRNGNVVVGVDTSTNQAAYWSYGFVTDMNLGAGSVANSCNADGTVIVGERGNQPFIWEVGNGSGNVQNLPLLPATTSGEATLISADGSTIAGYCGGLPVIWTVAGVNAFPGTASTVLNAISDDGTVIACDYTGGYQLYDTNVNYAINNIFPAQMPGLFKIVSSGFTISNLAVPIYNPDNQHPFEDIYCLTADGSQGFGGGYDLYRVYDQKLQMYVPDSDSFWAIAATASSSTNLWSLQYFEARSCNAQGTVLAGDAAGPTDFDDGTGLYYLGSIDDYNARIAFNGDSQDMLTFLMGRGATTTGWTLYDTGTQSMSADGSVILGTGTDPSNAQENWVAHITPTLLNLTPAQSSFVGGDSVQTAVNIDYPAGSDALINIASSNTAVISNISLTVPQGAMSTSFTFTSSTVTKKTTVVLTATMGSSVKTSTVTVNPVAIAITAFYPSAGTAVGGNAIVGTVQLGVKAPTGGTVVTLKSSAAGVAVPVTTTVAAGATSATFTINSTPVTAVAKVTLTATLGANTETTIVTVIPATITLIRVAPAPVVGGISTKSAVYLNGKAPTGGEVVKLSSSSTLAKLPVSVTVPAGSTATNCAVTTSVVASSTTVTLTAATASVTVTTNFVINPAVVYPAITAFYPSAGVIVGGNAASATVTLAAAAGTGGDVVKLSSDTVGITVPATVTVAAGQTTATVAITSTPVSATTKATLTASLGTSKESTIVTVIAPTVEAMVIAPSPVVGGGSTKVGVYLKGKAPAGGLVVALSTTSTAVKLPASILVPAGATSGNVTVTTSMVTSAVTVVVTSRTGATAVTSSFVVNP